MYSSNTLNSQLTAAARSSIKGNWGKAIVVFILFLIISFAINLIPVAGSIISFLITGAMLVGYYKFNIALSRNDNPNVNLLFNGFSQFATALGGYILMIIFITLWSLLLVIPGIIAAFRYSQMWFILAENKDMGPLEAISKSKEMMIGNKWKLLCLGLRFIGWWFIGIITLGIGFIWIAPYYSLSRAKFYDDLKPVKSEAAE